MTQLRDDKALMELGRRAFLEESGAALIKKYSALGDELFTETGYRSYAEDLLVRMTNSYLADTVARAGRDIVRKLGINERIFGTMSLALDYGIEPRNLALGAASGIAVLVRQSLQHNLPADLRVDDWRVLDLTGIEAILAWVWGRPKSRYSQRLVGRTHNAMQQLIDLVGR
jgi:mannitol-1-phosphate/altronate dehydrogenase